MNITTIHRFVCFSLLVLVAPLSAAAQEGSTDADAVKAFLRENFAESNSCMVIGLLNEHGSRVFSVGKMDNGTDQEVNGDTVFEIGSNTKTFTALLLLEMVQRGEMKLDEPVAKYLPARVKVPAHGGKEITLLNLAAQDSGLPFNADNLSNKTFPANYNDYTVGDLYAFLSEYKLLREPGAKFEYSNVGMSLLGHVMELKAGTDYESLVVNRICRPLDMDDTRIKLTPELKARIATGHDKDGKRAPYLNLQVMAGTGALCSTANDLLKYLSANLGFSQTDLGPLMEEMQVIRHTGSPQWGKTAMPWVDHAVYNPPGSELLGHAGGTPGFSTFIGFDKKQRRGVVVLSSQRAMPSGGIGWAILQGMPLTRESGTRLVREIAGIGTALASDEKSGMLLITKVFPKSPAARAGLSAGLVIQRINDISVEGKSLEECVGTIGGPIGTKVRLELLDPEREETKTVELTRQKLSVSN